MFPLSVYIDTVYNGNKNTDLISGFDQKLCDEREINDATRV